MVEHLNLIDHYTKTVKEYLDSPEIFIEASAYHLVSNLLGRFCVCPIAPGTDGMSPNVWIIISSIPARGRRSTVANYCNKVYVRASTQYYGETETFEDDMALRQRVENTYIEEGTPEGIVDHIQDSNFQNYYINSTEFGSVLQGMSSKDYELGVATLYSKLYYGESHSFYLSRRGKDNQDNYKRYLKPNKYVTMFCGLQEPYLYITPTMLRQGLIRRILVVYADEHQFGNWIEPMQLGRSDLPQKLNEISNIFANRMIEYNSYCTSIKDASSKYNKKITIGMQPSVMKAINNYSYQLDQELIKNVSNVTIYKQTLWEHLAKYAIVHSIARGNIRADFGDVEGRVDKQDLEAAYRFLMAATKNTDGIISELGRQDGTVQIAETQIERIYTIIKNDQPVNSSDLLRQSKLKHRDLNELLSTLLKSGRVTAKKTRSGKIVYNAL